MDGKKLKKIREVLQLTQDELGENIQEKGQKIRDIESNRTKMSVMITRKIMEKLHISSDWLLTGEGEMFKENTKSTPSLVEEEDTVPVVRHVDDYASAGWGTDSQTEEYDTVSYPISFLKSLGISTFKNLHTIKAFGDSMAPLINDGDELLLQKDPGSIKDDHIYIFEVEGEIFVKKIVKQKKGVKAIPANKEYPSMEYPQINIIALVLCSINAKRLTPSYNM